MPGLQRSREAFRGLDSQLEDAPGATASAMSGKRRGNACVCRILDALASEGIGHLIEITIELE